MGDVRALLRAILVVHLSDGTQGHGVFVNETKLRLYLLYCMVRHLRRHIPGSRHSSAVNKYIIPALCPVGGILS